MATTCPNVVPSRVARFLARFAGSAIAMTCGPATDRGRYPRGA
jgi:hypothetical protein